MTTSAKKLLRNFIVELAVYGGLVVVYFLAVLRFLGQPLTELFRNNLGNYAIAALVLIVLQGVALEYITSFLIERLGLERVE